MTKDSQIKALAILDGYEFPDPDRHGVFWIIKGNRSVAGDCESVDNILHVLPNYLEIYDSIIPLILKQREGIQRDIACAVWQKMKNNQEITNTELTLSFMAAMFKQTPEQLSEYLLRATGKWLD